MNKNAEYVALRNRILLPLPQPIVASENFGRFAREMRHYALEVPFFEPTKIKTILAGMKGKLLTRYTNAFESLKSEPVCRRDSYLNCFIKTEKFAKATLSEKPARVIQGRDPRYNLTLMKYLKAVEHWFYAKPYVVKGKNLEQRATFLKEQLSVFAKPCVYMIDNSKHDAHCSTPVLKLEHKIYNKAFRYTPELVQLLLWQLENKGKTPNGWAYSTKGRRASGDFNTGLGNTIICCALLKAAAKTLRVRYRMASDGDDCYLITGSPLSALQLRQLRQFYLDCGFEITLTSSEPEQLIHCQSSLIETPVPIMVRKPWDTISKSLASQKYFTTRETTLAYLRQVGMCELSLGRGVPIMQSFAKYLLRCTEQAKTIVVDEDLHRFLVSRAVAGKEQTVTVDARLSFEAAFGIDMCEQRKWEEVFDHEDILGLME